MADTDINVSRKSHNDIVFNIDWVLKISNHANWHLELQKKYEIWEIRTQGDPEEKV